ncbi:expressed unknown protein [Seminavis robusta]|uniref:Uncharacterized protein n=1 Tax=Seminavis robusta TaxID=568900 RepID=A0A9N8H649_9STRA|nr:expressed unknown protein [Seminavis robusta]|eukprot:Sro102_g052261.1  (118) ;mRNA; r:118165-118518
MKTFYIANGNKDSTSLIGNRNSNGTNQRAQANSTRRGTMPRQTGPQSEEMLRRSLQESWRRNLTCLMMPTSGAMIMITQAKSAMGLQVLETEGKGKDNRSSYLERETKHQTQGLTYF